MPNLLWIRIAALYFPLLAAILAALAHPRSKRIFASCLLSILWTLPTLVLLQRVNLIMHWWSFSNITPALSGMPLELYIGWTILWGCVPILTFRRLSIPEVLIVFGALDLWLMPLCSPLLKLTGPQWLIGEAAAILLVLTPAYCLARWTLDNTHLPLRVALQATLSGLLFLFLLPELAFALRPTPSIDFVWHPLFRMPQPLLAGALQCVAIAALPGISAAQEFAQRGLGTPIPYDPPQRLVTSGIYRYCASPMQLSCTVVTFLWALALHNPWLIFAASIAAVYSAGIAHWDEGRDLGHRFGESWQRYRTAVPVWRFRWHPYHSGQPDRLYISRTCGQCSVIRQWIEAHNPIGLTLIDAEALPQGSIRRMRYHPADGTPPQGGLLAFARALEHINLYWAWCGMILRLPILHQALQLLLDFSGFGPRTIVSACAPIPSSQNKSGANIPTSRP